MLSSFFKGSQVHVCVTAKRASKKVHHEDTPSHVVKTICHPSSLHPPSLHNSVDLMRCLNCVIMLCNTAALDTPEICNFLDQSRGDIIIH